MTELTDEFRPATVESSTPRFQGLRWDVQTDHVRLANDQVVVRDFLVHPGAVGIVALDDRDRVLLVRQYRHPTGSYLWEPPAGLMDVPGEPAWQTAQRELFEEAGFTANRWDLLADWYNSPGGSSETFRCFLARDLVHTPEGRPAGREEEADMPVRWVDLDEVLSAVFAGALHNPTAVTGVLATWAARARGWADLRPPDSPWPQRDQLAALGHVWQP